MSISRNYFNAVSAVSARLLKGAEGKEGVMFETIFRKAQNNINVGLYRP